MNWQEACESPLLKDLPFKIELNHWGQVVMSPAKNRHSVHQFEIQRILINLIKNGKAIPECSVQTSDNVKVADVGWISEARYEQVKTEAAYSIAPEICVEVRSASNTAGEFNAKKRLYFQAGAEEVWRCSEDGGLTFFDRNGELNRSRLFPSFPNQVNT